MSIPARQCSDARMRSIGQLIEDRRLELGMTQAFVIQKLNVSIHRYRSAVSRFATNKPDAGGVLTSLSVALGWPPAFLAGLISEKYNLNADPFDLPEDRDAATPKPAWRKPARRVPMYVVPDTNNGTMQQEMAALRAQVDRLQETLDSVVLLLTKQGKSRKAS
jgi:hypothetical protein